MDTSSSAGIPETNVPQAVLAAHESLALEPRVDGPHGVDVHPGSEHGVRLEPEQLVAAVHAAGRPAAERDTLCGLRRRYEVPLAA